MNRLPAPAKPALLGLAALAATALAYVFADQPLARLAFAHFHNARQPFVLMTRIVDFLDLFALAGLIWALQISWRGAAIGPASEKILRLSLAVLAALGAKELLKLAFGRTWPETFTCGNPSFIGDGTFGFFPFHGGAGWAAFPSGHETVAAAFAAALWVLAPRLRPLAPLLALLVGIGLLGADYHWLSDILAGALLGVSIGLLVARVKLSRAPS